MTTVSAGLESPARPSDERYAGISPTAPKSRARASRARSGSLLSSVMTWTTMRMSVPTRGAT
jgi:hypothetical protein